MILLFLNFISEILLYSGILSSLYLLLLLKFIRDSSFTLNNTLHQHFHSLFFWYPWPQQSSCRSVQGQSSMYSWYDPHTVAQKQAVKRSCLIIPFFWAECKMCSLSMISLSCASNNQSTYNLSLTDESSLAESTSDFSGHNVFSISLCSNQFCTELLSQTLWMCSVFYLNIQWTFSHHT